MQMGVACSGRRGFEFFQDSQFLEMCSLINAWSNGMIWLHASKQASTSN